MSVFGQKGLVDWVVQRTSAIFIVVYVLAIYAYWLWLPFDHVLSDWSGFLFSPAMVISGLLASLSAMVHAMIGIWTVFTDYIHDKSIQMSLLLLTYIMIVFSCTWAIIILAS